MSQTQTINTTTDDNQEFYSSFIKFLSSLTKPKEVEEEKKKRAVWRPKNRWDDKPSNSSMKIKPKSVGEFAMQRPTVKSARSIYNAARR